MEWGVEGETNEVEVRVGEGRVVKEVEEVTETLMMSRNTVVAIVVMVTVAVMIVAATVVTVTTVAAAVLFG